MELFAKTRLTELKLFPMPERNTKQRAVILKVLEASSRPFTRAEIHQLAAAELPSIGFATVSRAVNELLASGTIVRLQYPGQPDRYEMASAQEHPHILCSQCRKIFDLPIAMPQVQIPQVDSFELFGYEVLFFGQCPHGRKCPHWKTTRT